MLQYVLVVNPDICNGCRRCEMTCSLKKTGNVISPTKSRIRIIKIETIGVDTPMVCRHCLDAPCKNVCPTHAIFTDSQTGAVLIEENKCIGCRECMLACPFGAISLDVDRGALVKCDLCQGDPACVKTCMWGAITYERAGLADIRKKREAMERLQEAVITSSRMLVSS